MNLESLLRSKRTPTLLVQKPNLDIQEYWDIELVGLHNDQIKASVSEFRAKRQKAGEKISQPSLKNSDLLDNLAIALGARSYKQWLSEVAPALADFIARNQLLDPADLVRWEDAPFMSSMTARQIADRLFNSNHPIPKRLFTGVGNLMFAAKGYGPLDFTQTANRLTATTKFSSLRHTDAIEFAADLHDQVVLRAQRLDSWSTHTPDYLDLTAQVLVLNAFEWTVACTINLLGDSIVEPMVTPMEAQLYKADETDLEECRQFFSLFRAEIDRTDVGWVDVLPFNDNLIFLRASDGRFDWVVRDQRDAPFSQNNLFPIFRSDELPKALRAKPIQAYLHYEKGIWLDKLRHQANHHHYKSGGNSLNYPGQEKAIERYLAATQGYKPSKQQQAPCDRQFTPHTLNDKCLMVSDLVTIADFQEFLDSGWKSLREQKSALTAREWPSLPSMNVLDSANYPVCVTWYDAIAYCNYLEQKEGLPLRLLSIEEWQTIAPSRATIKSLGPKAQAHVVEAMTLDGEVHEPPTYGSKYFTRFKDELCWVRNEEGLEFLSSLTFGEWLSDYRGEAPDHVFAPVACTASGIALGRGPLERELFEAWYVGKNNHLKVGFRVCYVADLNS